MSENSDLEGIKSGASITQEFIRFINLSDRVIGIFWINYIGIPAFYKLLKPLECLDVNTYVGHPWICVDIKTKERFLANGSRIYFPSPGYKNRVLTKLQSGLVRLNVKINPPLRDLKTLVYKQLVKMLPKEEDVDLLELPFCLQRELKSFIKQEKRFDNINNFRKFCNKRQYEQL